MPHKPPAKLRTKKGVRFPKGSTGIVNIRTGKVSRFPKGATGLARIKTRRAAPHRRSR